MKKGAFWCGLILALAGVAFWFFRQLSRPGITLPPAPRSVEDVMAILTPVIEPIWQKRCARAGVAYPPSRLVLVGLKLERLLEIYAPDASGRLRLLHTFPILAASGQAGPKLREGDLQVPEGFYRTVLLNPNSRFHLSLRLDYPSQEDISQAQADDRDTATLGGDIMIHGSSVSTGCLAMGDPAAEEIFFLASRVGLENISVLLAPSAQPIPTAGQPSWIQERYRRLQAGLSEIRRP